MEHLEKMKDSGLQKLILDLRDNGGGMLDDAVQIADEFLGGNKQIVSTKGANVSEQIFSARRPGLFEEGKLVLLINENSASASEVLAGALQDWNRATIVGRRSFGKGLVQEQFILNDGSAIRLTVARYFTPMGRCIQKPYHNGIDTNYKQEVSQRIKEGEILTNNHSQHIGKPLKLQDGRVLYSEEGISPDVFVPVDSVRWLLNLQSNDIQNTMTDAALKYYRNNSHHLKRMKEVAELRSYLNKDPQMQSVLNTWCQSLPPGISISKCKEIFMSDFEDLIAWMNWNLDGYYKSASVKDTAVQKAISILND
jgi:carboxyl-terminal processing protease